MDHERLEPEPGHGIDDGLVRIQVRVPPRGYGLLPRGVQVPDPIPREVEHDGLERWFVHARTLPTLISGNSEILHLPKRPGTKDGLEARVLNRRTSPQVT